MSHLSSSRAAHAHLTGRRWFASFLFMLLSTAAVADDFVCPDGARDSGPQLPGDVIRWCEISRDGRLLYHGDLLRWYRNGKRRAKEFYFEGTGEGEWASWFPNGRQASLGFFTHGHKAGTWLYWTEAGRVRAEVAYGENGDHWTAYYPSGKKRATGKAIRSGKIGPWTYWDAKGREKARCDFGMGLSELKSDGCRMIADEVEPLGFSTPVPAVTTAEARATLQLNAETYTFAIPEGWKPRTQQQVPLLLEPESADAHAMMPEIHVRLLYRKGGKFERVVTNELVRLRKSVTRYAEQSTTKEKVKDGRSAISKRISYRTVAEVDSPSSLVAESAVYEHVTFIDASDQVVVMAAMRSHSPSRLKASAPALATLLIPFQEPPPVAATLPEPPAPPPMQAAPANPFSGFD